MPFVGKVFALARVTVHPLGLWASSHFDFRVYCGRADVLALGLLPRCVCHHRTEPPLTSVVQTPVDCFGGVRNLL